MAWSKELYQWYKDMGICCQCGCKKAAPKRIRCEECLASNAESAKKRREKWEESERKKDNEVRKKARNKRKEEGNCIFCGKPKTASSTCFCIDCRIKNRRRNERRKQGIDRNSRASYGLCYICGKSLDRSGKLCSICSERATNNLPKMRYNTKWKIDNNLIFKKYRKE